MDHWQKRISRPERPAVPIRLKRMRRTFWAPPGYEHLLRYVATHPSFTQREAAEALSMTLAAVERALKRLAQWGALIVTTTRGRFGRTRVRVQSDVGTANVSPTGERVFLRPNLRFSSTQTSTVADTLSDNRGPGWLALKAASWMGGVR